jgi:hypothetical protein
MSVEVTAASSKLNYVTIGHIAFNVISVGAVYYILNKKISQLETENKKLLELIEELKQEKTNGISPDVLNNIYEFQNQAKQQIQNLYSILSQRQQRAPPPPQFQPPPVLTPQPSTGLSLHEEATTSVEDLDKELEEDEPEPIVELENIPPKKKGKKQN